MQEKDFKQMTWRALALLLGVLAVFFFVLIFVAIGTYRTFYSTAPVTNTITVTGTGEITAVPDIAQVYFTVSEDAVTSEDAQELATKKTNAAIAFLKDAGIAEKDIKTTGYSINPKVRYETDVRIMPCTQWGCPPYNPGKEVIDGYTVTQSIELKIRDTDKTGEILAGLGDVGINNLGNVNFVFDDEQKIQDDARAEAIKDARAEAKTLAKNLGVRLGRVVSYQEGGSWPYYLKAESAVSNYADDRDGAVPPELPIGENEVTASVTVVYEIR